MLVYVRPSNEALPGRAFREHRTNVGVLPILFIVGALRAQRPCQLSRHFPSNLARYSPQEGGPIGL